MTPADTDSEVMI